MDTTKRMRIVLANTPNKQSGRKFFFNCIISVMIALELSSYCKAQCSNSRGNIGVYSRPQLLKSTIYPCSWSIAVPDAERTWLIQVRVVHVDLECCCDSDYLLIKDGSDSAARSIVALCSGGELINPTTITSSGPTLYVEFINDGDMTGSEYSLQFVYFDSKVSCPGGWVSRRGFCYKLYHEPVPWQQAASRCGYDGGFLTSIVDQEENDFLLGEIILNCSAGIARMMYYQYPTINELRCYTLELDKNGAWSDSNCEQEQNNFICKKTQDGSGGRYWTALHGRKGDSSGISDVNKILIWFIVAAILLLIVFFQGRRESCLYPIMKDCMKSPKNSCVGCIRVVLKPCSICIETIRKWYQRRTTRTSSPCSSQPTAPEPTNRAPLAQTIFRRGSTSSETDDYPRREFGTTQSPSTYSDDVISEAPPPSYIHAVDDHPRREFETTQSPSIHSDDHDVKKEAAPPSYIHALAPTFDVSYNDPRGSETSINARESIAAPSYEFAVAGFQTTI
eukprot:XP_011676316.1 PREDICTED: uncharacterized protein LOC105444156 [Strongylocentrotus purpuratus]